MTLDPFALPEQLNLAEEFLYRRARERPERPAIYFEDQVITYGQLADQTDRATAVFKAHGLEQEQRVLLMVPDVPQFASAWLGVVKAGGVVSAVNPDVKPEEARYYLNYTRAKILVADEQAAATVEAIRSEVPHLKHVLVVGRSYDDALTKAKPDPTFAPTHRDDPAVWLYTSGSTGLPKGATHKHRDFVFNALTYALPVVGYGATDKTFSVPRLAFGYALGSNLLFPLIAGGSCVLFKEKGSPEKLLEVLAKHRPTLLVTVPTSLNQVVSHDAASRADWSSVRVAISAGEALPAELYQRWKKTTKVEVLDGIGSAEMFHIFITNRVGDVKLGSLGKLVEGYRAKVCDDAGNEVARGDVGTLWVSGDSMALEYWQNRDKSRQTFRGEWCVSADKFQQDDEGYFYFCGRGDDMLKVGGKWLSPVEVENALLQHPAVREAAVVGFKDKDGLDKPRAFVALNAGKTADDALAEALKAHVRDTLAPFKAPRDVVFIDALPRSDRGKVLKTELRK
ncbi:MAG: benzoate-CoA ligase family protein [Myxococcaceae bacterium]|nr:benzoate-CoA ligase family protein [Myxococcaceae bacterium]